MAQVYIVDRSLFVCQKDYPIACRVTRPGGYVFMIIPHKERTFDAPRNRTTLSELLQRHNVPPPETPGHHSVWTTVDVLELCQHFNWTVVAVQDIDDKVGNGFTVVIQK